MTVETVERHTQAPPGAGAWIRKNLFSSRLDSALTVTFGGLSVYLLFRVLRFVFVNARWEIIEVNLKLLLVGRWPADELGVMANAVVALGLWGGFIAGVVAGRRVRAGTSTVEGMPVTERIADLTRRFGLSIATALLLLLLTDTSGPWLMVGALTVAAIAGRLLGSWVGRQEFYALLGRYVVVALISALVGIYLYLVATVPLADWEGFFFNVTAAAAGIILCFPLGVILALGRRSKMRLLQWMSITYIEFVRGAPLFVLLLMANVSLEFFVPPDIAPSKVIRAIVTFTIFTAAYVAEIVRGGLQSVPRGQEEAAKALGLSPYKQTSRIVLPQALRNVIPAQIGQFISLFKDTTLAGLALGIFELLEGSKAITQQQAFRGQGLIIETLVFVGFLFWVGSFTMSRESQRLEKRLGVGTR